MSCGRRNHQYRNGAFVGRYPQYKFPAPVKNPERRRFQCPYQSTVGDNPKRLLAALSIAQTRAQIIILTGGLGPTRGDITAQTVADFLGRPLVLSEEWLKKWRLILALVGLP